MFPSRDYPGGQPPQQGHPPPPQNPWHQQHQHQHQHQQQPQPGRAPSPAEQPLNFGLAGVGGVAGYRPPLPPMPAEISPITYMSAASGLSLSSPSSLLQQQQLQQQFQQLQLQQQQQQQQREQRQQQLQQQQREQQQREQQQREQQFQEPPSVLRSAINAPQFVPKGTGDTPPFRPTSSPSLPPSSSSSSLQGGLGYLKSSAAPFNPGAALNKLGVQAAPFVPGGGGGGGGGLSSSSSSNMSKGIVRASSSVSVDGLNTQAMPFQPGGAGGGGGRGGGQQQQSAFYDEDEDEGGGADFEEDGQHAGGHHQDYYGDEIFDWSVGASSLPAPPRKTLQRMGVPEQLRQFFLLRDLDKLRALPPDDARYKEIPPRYHQAYPLDDTHKARGTTGAFGYPSVIYKVLSHDDGNVYALRRFDSVRTNPKIVSSVVESWRRIQHPNIVKLNKAFIQHGNALFFVHEYFPGAQSITQRYVNTARGQQQQQQRLPEKLLWSFITQLVSALRTVHSAQAACRMLHPNYVLVTTGARLRLGCCGVPDVLESETRKSIAELQTEDLHMLGRLIVILATRSLPTNPQTLSTALSLLPQHYSPDLHALALQLCSKPGSLSIFDLGPLLSRHVMDELDRQYAAVDDLEGHLSHEYESGRLFRLSMKLAQVTERPEAQDGQDPAWAETGNRYILKLFQVRKEEGRKGGMQGGREEGVLPSYTAKAYSQS